MWDFARNYPFLAGVVTPFSTFVMSFIEVLPEVLRIASLGIGVMVGALAGVKYYNEVLILRHQRRNLPK
jgi:hypothetical protein